MATNAKRQRAALVGRADAAPAAVTISTIHDVNAIPARVVRVEVDDEGKPTGVVSLAAGLREHVIVSAEIVARLDAAERAALVRGDHAAHAALAELHVAAGLLKAKAATRAQELAGADRELAEMVRDLL